MNEIHIVDWDRFQHYKDRSPPWIKNYTELLADDDYLSLTGNRRAILHGLWLAYAMSHRRLADDTASLSRRLGLKVTRQDLLALNHAGFLVIAASNPLADRYRDASPHALAREETETEELKPEGSNVIEKIFDVVNEASYEETDDDENLQSREETNYLLPPQERIEVPSSPFAGNGLFSPGVLPAKDYR